MTLNTFFIATTHAAPVPSIDPIIGCADKISSSCGPKVYAFIFEESGVLSQDCCWLLLKEGKECHDNLTNSILSKGGFSTEETEEILEKNSEVWNLCKRSGHIGGTQAAPATIIQPLKGCAGKVTSACGPKIYEFVFDNSGILSEKCCARARGFSTEETEEILERNSEVWNLCKKSSHIGGTQAVPTPIVQPLKGCVGKVTSACGPKIYEFVFDNSGVPSEKCCERLLNAGKECHDSDTNSILKTEEILERNSKVWNLCKRSGHIGGTQAAPATIVQPLKGCASKVTSACGPKIYEFVFDNSGILSEKCCEQLLNAGRECHDSDTNSILSEGEFSKEEREEVLARHSEVWNLCKRSGHIGGTQPVPTPTVQPLTGCAGKVTSACGPKVYAFVFDKSGVLSEKCCKLLLNGGRQCHDSETNSILSEGEFSAEEKKEIMKRHNQVWNLCKKNGHIGRECHDNDTNSILSEGEFSKEERRKYGKAQGKERFILEALNQVPCTNRKPITGVAGRQCHDSETNSILSEGEFSAEEKKEIVKRHNQVWNLCKKNGHIDKENTVF
ncbi:hypothetical protein Cgig2_033725 [Carnegiea gigantea]|uniref:Prolamin-like domain-containing protein n=1 Tax=Carnegiea gigantea TaxID=171969 RepID=A0A9Q1JF12_9CARY|nr:hypothetical protein Cgig2_033725 [Carnegiea gigantea]